MGTFGCAGLFYYGKGQRARECIRDILDEDEGAKFRLTPAWITSRVEEGDTNRTYVDLELSKESRFEALFVILGLIRSTLRTVRPIYAVDSTHTRSRYHFTLLFVVGMNAEDRMLPSAWALVPIENEIWWS
jgi:hypothetical protein